MTTLLDAVDYRRFLVDALALRGLSQSELAKRLGRSKPWISLVLSHQRPLDPTLLPEVAVALDLDVAEQTHLAALVDLESPSGRARRTAWATLRANWAHRRSPGLADEVAMSMRHWWVVAVYELSRCEGWRPQPAWIAKTLCPPISEEQASAALRTLVDLGMLVEDDAHGLAPSVEEPTYGPHDLPAGVQSAAHRQVHTDLLSIASDGLHQHQHNERYAAAVISAISEEQFLVVRHRLEELLSELVQLAHAPQPATNRVYALTVQMTPLSDYTDSGDGDQST